MCIAMPVKVAEILDLPRGIVAVEGGNGREEVNAGLVADSPAAVGDLLGRWVVTHVGFVMSVLDEADAQSRLAVFAALDGLAVPDEALRPDDFSIS